MIPARQNPGLNFPRRIMSLGTEVKLHSTHASQVIVTLSYFSNYIAFVSHRRWIFISDGEVWRIILVKRNKRRCQGDFLSMHVTPPLETELVSYLSNTNSCQMSLWDCLLVSVETCGHHVTLSCHYHVSVCLCITTICDVQTKMVI